MKSRPTHNEDSSPAMPFNEALKRVWSAPPMPKVKPKVATPSEPNMLTDEEQKSLRDEMERASEWAKEQLRKGKKKPA